MIFVLAGTSDAREVAISLKDEGFQVLASVVTESGAKSLEEAGIEARVGRLTAEDMGQLLHDIGAAFVVDASHPFAEEASKNAVSATKAANIPYIRYERQSSAIETNENITFVSSYKEAAEFAAKHKGVVMLTTGSKTLATFAKKLLGLPDIRMIARMLPRKDNMELCDELGVEQRNIVAMQGPFSKELNVALYKQYGVTLVITKESGKIGSVDDKIEAAKELHLHVVVIERPKQHEGYVVDSKEAVIKTVKKLKEAL
ncbi:precorrin-6A reductase [Halalkalibacter urbisdiaboli]|uniref:precorrin-6A reductase n=1 Tax=Halalkalibacter urbisdiaboli TaxID=1960589 RepID=UPI000B43982A|nr:precorrin-6A reductase [Halalkalibacter urbisdiaboli]